MIKVRFIKDYDNHDKGAVIELSEFDAWELIERGIAERFVPKQIKRYRDKMMKQYSNKG